LRLVHCDDRVKVIILKQRPDSRGLFKMKNGKL